MQGSMNTLELFAKYLMFTFLGRESSSVRGVSKWPVNAAHPEKFQNNCRKYAKMTSQVGAWLTGIMIVTLAFDRIWVTPLLFEGWMVDARMTSGNNSV